MIQIRLALLSALCFVAGITFAGQSTLSGSADETIQAHYYKSDVGTVFGKVVDSVILLDWKLKSKDVDAGVIVAHTPKSMRSFGDKVTILVSATNDGRVRVDMSSKSKLGAGGLGKNKKNIRLLYEYLDGILGVTQ